MALAAAQVVDALAARLAPVVLSGGRVYTSRLWPLTEADLPAWKVTAQDETVDLAQLDGLLGQHTLSIEAAGFVRATTDIDDAMNALAAAGLTALFADSIPYAMRLEGIDRDITQDGEASMGVIRLRIATTFFTNPAEPEIIL